jgi:hypothetical protein
VEDAAPREPGEQGRLVREAARAGDDLVEHPLGLAQLAVAEVLEREHLHGLDAERVGLRALGGAEDFVGALRYLVQTVRVEERHCQRVERGRLLLG